MGVNLNSWLWKEGYLVLKDGATPGEAEWFLNVDWPKPARLRMRWPVFFSMSKAANAMELSNPEKDALPCSGNESQA
jgi:hypothetical protein